MILRQSTAKAISFGPFVDKTDGVTPETGLVSALDHASTGILLSKNGGALTIRHATVTATTYDAYGNYIVTLDTTDTNTVGTMRMQFIETATCLPVWMDFNIVEEAVYDELFAASAIGYIANQPVDVNTIKTQSVTLAGGVTFPAATLASTTNITAGTVTAGTVSDKTGYALTSGERSSVADALLARNVAGGSSTGRIVSEALYFLRNKWTVSSGTLTVYGTDDTTSSWTATIGTDAAAVPIVSNDPA